MTIEKIVCPLIKDAHKKWEDTPGRGGKKHGKSAVRWLPVVLRLSDRKYYPEEWENEVKKYHKNLKQLL